MDGAERARRVGRLSGWGRKGRGQSSGRADRAHETQTGERGADGAKEARTGPSKRGRADKRTGGRADRRSGRSGPPLYGQWVERTGVLAVGRTN